MTIRISPSWAFLHNIGIGIRIGIGIWIGSGNTPLQRTVYFSIFVFVVKLIVLFQSGKLDYMQHLNLIFFLYFFVFFFPNMAHLERFLLSYWNLKTFSLVEKCIVLVNKSRFRYVAMVNVNVVTGTVLKKINTAAPATGRKYTPVPFMNVQITV